MRVPRHLTAALLALFLLTAATAVAADEIHLYGKQPIEGEIVKVEEELVTYRPAGGDELKTIKLRFIKFIRYEDGREVTPGELRRQALERERGAMEQERARRAEERRSAERKDNLLSLILAGAAAAIFFTVYLVVMG